MHFYVHNDLNKNRPIFSNLGEPVLIEKDKHIIESIVFVIEIFENYYKITQKQNNNSSSYIMQYDPDLFQWLNKTEKEILQKI